MDELIKRLRELQAITEHCDEQSCDECENRELCDKHDNKTLSGTYKEAADAVEELQKRLPKTPHGRLIDADALMLKILDYIDEYSDVDEKGWHNLKWCAMKETEMAINDAPTIIPAEEGE